MEGGAGADPLLRQMPQGGERHAQALMIAAAERAQEEEREWIAIEIHDRIAQTLASAFQQLQVLQDADHGGVDVRQVAATACALLRQAIREARHIMQDLHPPFLDEFLDDLGLVPVMSQELRRFREDSGALVRLDAAGAPRLRREVEVALYRIFHEALVNVRRHAPSARCVVVSMGSTNEVVTMEIRDDGSGFDVHSAGAGKRVGGLMSMRRRAELVGGRLEVSSTPGGGTRVSARVPIHGLHLDQEQA